jgi:hypothetical protein
LLAHSSPPPPAAFEVIAETTLVGWVAAEPCRGSLVLSDVREPTCGRRGRYNVDKSWRMGTAKLTDWLAPLTDCPRGARILVRRPGV